MRLTSLLLTLTALALSVSSAPSSSLLPRSSLQLSADAPTSAEWKIHESCNGTQRAQIAHAVAEMQLLAQTAISHVLNKPGDEFFVKYFGEGADPAPVVGYYTQLVHGDRSRALLRCDDPDGNCRFPGWAGHWRGNNATSETVICELSYTSRRPLTQLCALGFQLARDNPSTFFGADLMHRAFHVPQFAHDMIHHYADTYSDCVKLAKEDSGKAVSNQHSLQYFALDVFSRRSTKWGCVGGDVVVVDKDDDDKHAHGSAEVAATATSSSTVASATATPTQAASTAEAAKDCHTHADGSIHCGTH